MSDDLVNVSAQALKDLAKALERYRQQVDQATKDAYKAIGRIRWQDKKREQFEAHFKEFQHSSGRFLGGEVQEMVKSLNELASRIEHARNTRM